MESLKIKQWHIRYDYESTVNAYSQVEHGDPERCGCIYCRNFIRARNRLYPKQFRDFLASVGIDYMKEAEVYEISPHSSGCHLYGGCFYFIGTLQEITDNQAHDIELSRPSGEDFVWSLVGTRGLAHEAFRGQPLVEVNFKAKVPWVLEQQEPE
jgi:hypothetical protein